ncbi:RDD family protein [Gracilibacillus xinjiangensis]|uniref:RDD family protein n=1 Tax=Gracilibacillus xinjiangensis TaxID=1193282 RepID=A0ABV8WRI9_9BACI
MHNFILLKRVCAFAIDVFILNTLVFLLAKGIESILGISTKVNLIINPFLFPNIDFSFITFTIFCIIVIINWVLLPSSPIQGTVGMAIFRLKMMERYTSARISIQKSFIRYIMSCISFAILGIGFLIALFSENQLTLHDRVAKTKVI